MGAMKAPFEFVAAAHTPFDERGAIDLDAVAPLAGYLRSVGVSGVLVAGSTGEGPSLTASERRRLAEAWVESAGGGLQVMIQVGHCSIPEAASLARHAMEIGADAVCAAPPHWFKVTSATQLAETCRAVAEAARDLPFFYYHIPVLSGVNVRMIELLDLVRESIPNFAGVKFTHDDLDDFTACVRTHGPDVRMMWGVDEALIQGLENGAVGAVGSTYNFAMPIYAKLVAAFRAGKMGSAKAMQSRSIELVDVLARRGYGASSKALMGLLGVECGPVRLPLQGIGPGEVAHLRTELESLEFFEWIGR